ncbi:flagellar biosynthesis protein FlhB [candidate division KSB1 bacterium]|nr:MAG: flagellar biosynthesis protein FlhB [candidate division KSB1 bacterium]
MPEEDQQEKTERATPKRREEARKKGNVAKSIEINSSAVLLALLLFFKFMGGYVYRQVSYYSQLLFENFGTMYVNRDNLPGYIQLGGIVVAKIIGPVILTLLVVSLISNFAQVGPMLTFEPLIPKFDKLNPFSGFKKILFSRRSLEELVKNIFKILLIGLIAYLTIKGDVKEYIPLMDKAPSQIFKFVTYETFKVGLRIALVLLALSIFDYMFQRWEYERSIMMTKQEVKEEYKQLEGDPHIKARIRSIQREMARRRMIREIPEADVVITNPTEIAVALKYDSNEMEAPTVVAKGKGKIAEKIKKIAIENDIPIVENKPLAQALYKATEIGDEIPEEFFQAVAEVLAYVYKLKNKKVA